MRLFVAVEIPETLAARVADAAGELRRRVEARAPGARLTWIPAHRLHVTVRFIGEADDARAAAIGGVLAPPLDVAPFDLTIAGVGAFPRGGAPRTFWAGIGAGGDRMAAVEQEVSARLEACGIRREDRPYAPHLTLARVRDAAGLRAPDVLPVGDDAPVGTTRVQTITLFESRLSPTGPTYVPVLRTPLS